MTNVVIVDPPGAVEVTTDVMIDGARDVVGSAVVVGSSEAVVAGVEAALVVVAGMIVLDVEVTLITVGEVVVGRTTELVVSEVVSSVDVTEKAGLLLAMELEGAVESTEDDEGTEAADELVEEADGV